MLGMMSRMMLEYMCKTSLRMGNRYVQVQYNEQSDYQSKSNKTVARRRPAESRDQQHHNIHLLSPLTSPQAAMAHSFRLPRTAPFSTFKTSRLRTLSSGICIAPVASL